MRVDYREDGYRQEVDKSIAFIGKGVDFFTEVKARCLQDIAKRLLGDVRRLKVLDIGCGVGLTDSFLTQSFGDLHGVDITQLSIDSASENNPSVHYQVYDGKVLPFADATFDLAFAVNVMHHVPPDAWHGFMKEMGRVVRKGGLGVVFEHNPFNPLTRLAVFRCSFDADAVLLRRSVMARIFRQQGLDPVEQRYILFTPFRSGILKAAEARLGWLPIGAQYYIAAAKPL